MTVVNAGEVQRFIRALRKVPGQVEELVEGGVTGPRLAIRIGLANALAEQLYRANPCCREIRTTESSSFAVVEV